MWWLAILMLGGLAVPKNSNGSWRGNLGSIPSPTMVAWLVDGNNLSCSRGVPNERETILRELATVASPRSSILGGGPKDPMPSKPISYVVIVFDGNEDEASDRTIVDEDKWLQWTVTDGRNRMKDRADDWIIENAIPSLHRLADKRSSGGMGKTRVNLVSADRELQKRVRATRILNGGSFVHPPKFWKDYLPVLQKQQIDQQ